MTARPRIYLDHAATTPILPAAKAAMIEAMERWANPSSPHAEGRAARAALEDARERIKRALGWTGELIFTSGATEAIEIALKPWGPNVAPTHAEHDAVLRAAGHVDGPTNRLDGLYVDQQGLIEDRFRFEHRNDAPDIAAVQSVNNETGVIQPLIELRALIDACNRPNPYGHVSPVLLFSDCAQSAGKLPLPPADLVAISAHKLGGPPGAGALLTRDFSLLQARGGQERGYRGGTENLPAIVGFAAALETQQDWLPKAKELRMHLEDRLSGAGAHIVASDAPRIPTIGAYRMPGVNAQVQLIHFDLSGISISAGSACSSGSMRASHVLRAMGWDEASAGEVIRVSFGPDTSLFEVDAFCDTWIGLASRSRAA